MTPLRRLLAFVLLGSWLIATQHCALEAAGWLDSHAEDASFVCCAETGPCTHDGCGQIERGSLPGSGASLKVTPPALHMGPCALCLLLAPPASSPEPAVRYAAWADHAVGWVPAWHLARRAAQPPRAPSLRLA